MRVHKLALALKALAKQTEICSRCGVCQAVCPVYSESLHEGDVARGKLALLDGLMLEMFKDADYVQERLKRCLLCGACAHNCSRGVNTLHIFMQARFIISEFRRLSRLERIFLRNILAKPKRFDIFTHLMAIGQHYLLKSADRNVGTSCAKMPLPFMNKWIGERHMKPLAGASFKASRQARSSRSEGGPFRVALFIGCLIDKVYPQIAQSVIDVLDHYEISVVVPQNQFCCGIPAISAGDRIAFKALVRGNIEGFADQPVDHILTACATCTFTLKKILPQMIETEYPELRNVVQTFSRKVMDISEFLVKTVGVGKIQPSQKENCPKRITYHDPCHLKKSLGIYETPRQLILENSGYKLVEMPESDRCCGMGGSFNINYYGLSQSIGRRKSENIKATKAQVVATGCPACMFQLSDMLSRSNYPAQVKHVIEIYAQTLKTK